jgi:citrate synthase
MTNKKNQINKYSEITPRIKVMAHKAFEADQIDQSLYKEYDVKRGLRDISGKGVLAGLTSISEIRAKKVVDGKEEPDYGHLFYRGYAIEDLVAGLTGDKAIVDAVEHPDHMSDIIAEDHRRFHESVKLSSGKVDYSAITPTEGPIDMTGKSYRFGFEEITYLLLFGELPNKRQMNSFSRQLVFYRSLPKNFVRDVIMKAPSGDMMNMLARCVLTMYSYDDNADDVSLPNVLRQSMQLISVFPMLAIYGYQANSYYNNGGSLYIHKPLQGGTLAENLLHILRPDGKYTELEARILDICLVLHMDHGGGNNSTFTTHVVSSTMTDTYSTMAAALGSLKGPRHGGANIKVVNMFDDLQKNVRDTEDDDEVSAYLQKLLDKKGFDHAGLIYGVGHAVYSKSDPRAIILKSYVKRLAEAKGDDMKREFELYDRVERLAPQLISGERQMYKGVSVNVDFYSGLVYEMLGLPKELFTPIFAIARIVGWSAHRMEELSGGSKIIRPAYRTVIPERDYIPIEERGRKV